MVANTGTMSTTGSEEQAVRDAVGDIVGSFGPDYTSNRSTTLPIVRSFGMRWRQGLPRCASGREGRRRGAGGCPARTDRRHGPRPCPRQSPIAQRIQCVGPHWRRRCWMPRDRPAEPGDRRRLDHTANFDEGFARSQVRMGGRLGQ